MEIIELHLKHYGKFQNARIALQSGVNVLYGDNEAGKTTIHSFIKAMLFGLNRSRGRGAKWDEYQMRQPWDTPGSFQGSMRVGYQGRIYRIDRDFSAAAPSLVIVCESDQRTLADPQGFLDELLGGMSEAAFYNTVYIPQSGARTEEALAEELRRYLISSKQPSLLGCDVSGALDRLRKEKKQTEKELKKENEALEKEIRSLENKEEQLRLRLGDLDEARGNLLSVENVRREEFLYEQANEKKPVKKGKFFLQLFLILAAVLCAAGFIFSEAFALKLYLGIFAIIFVLMQLPVAFLLGNDPEADEEQRKKKAEEKKTVSINSQMEKLRAQLSDTRDELAALYEKHSQDPQMQLKLDALNLAIDRICQLSTGICNPSEQETARRASRILYELTQGKYTAIELDNLSELRIHTADQVLGTRQVSQGTLNQIYFALRMACAELICSKEKVPILADEAFSMYDEKRLREVLGWLRECGHQVIIFSCQNREREILAGWEES